MPAVVDYKVKTTPLTQFKADHDFQPAVYLAGRWLEADPAAQFCFAQIAKPGPRRKEIERVARDHRAGRPASYAARWSGSRRSPGRSSRCYERFGPDEPWGFADPSGWKCSDRYCDAWATCPGGVGV